jgi:hypothetical protein
MPLPMSGFCIMADQLGRGSSGVGRAQAQRRGHARAGRLGGASVVTPPDSLMYETLFNYRTGLVIRSATPKLGSQLGHTVY